MNWAFINIIVAAIAFKSAFNRCLVSACVVFILLVLALCIALEVKLDGVWSFALGSMLYALPCIAAYSTKFTKKRAFMALFSCLLMLLELLAAYLWLTDSYAIVGLLYRPTALVLYSLLAIACFWGSNGQLHKRDGSYIDWHKYNMDHGQIDRMGFKRGRR